MIYRSVVGKLWITIIFLVSAILLFLSMALIEYFDHYYYEEQSDELINLGVRIANIFDEYSDFDVAISMTGEVIKSSESELVIVEKGKNGQYKGAGGIFTSEELNDVIENYSTVVRLNDKSYTDYITFNSSNDMLALAVPILDSSDTDKTIIIYQSLESLYQTTNDIKKIILLFVGIGILITTIFSFFLSTRITAPVREMQKAAYQIAEGDFNTKVNIKSTDELGDLALSFNQMAKQLDETIKALSSEKDKLSNILKSMADGVITFNKNGEIIISNPPAESLFYSWKEKRFILPDELNELLNKLFLQNKTVEQDIQLSGRIIAIKMAPLYSEDKINGAVALIRDVTYERKLNKLRRDFLGNVSHELRTPISMLQGYSEAILDDVVQSEVERKELVQIIYDESLRMGRLVNELLDITKFESGNYTLQYCKVDINNLVNKMIKKFNGFAKEQDIELVSNTDNSFSKTYLDADRIEQVLTNLIDNAIRHTPSGGTVLIRTKNNNDGTFLIEVEDSGIGISDEDLPFVFERFYKADKARTRNQSGTGLGLSIAKNIVQAHGGNISVASQLGYGTIFTIVIPFKNVGSN